MIQKQQIYCGMDLQDLERQRIKLYKQYLKQQMDMKSKIRKQENSYQKKKQQTNINQLIGKLNQDDIRRLQQRRYTAHLLKQQNSELNTLRKSGVQMEESNGGQNRGNSFMDNINKQEAIRRSKLKEGYINNTHDNQVQEYVRKDYQGKAKSVERYQEEKHMNRLKEIQQQRQKNYNQLKRKHQQDMKLYDKHSQLMNQNQQYRRMAQKFTECEEDIISRLKRNQQAQRKRLYKNNQQILKNQMGEYNQRKSFQRSQILQGNDIDQSIFKNLLHGSPNNKKLYGEELRSQMSQFQTRKSYQKLGRKEKIQIQGIFGGNQGRERHNQIQYIDRKMGLAPNMNRSNSISNSINNQQEEQQKKSQTDYKNKHNSISFEEMPISQKQKIEPKRSIQIQTRRAPHLYQQNVINMPISTYHEQNQSPKIQQKTKNPNLSPFRRQYQQKNNQYVYVNGQSSPNSSPKIFRSYDVVTGKNKFYG